MNYHRERCLVVQLAGALSALLLLLGCSTQPTRLGLTKITAPAPPLPTHGATLYHIDTTRSQLRILVYRGGVLGDLGHNHVIVTSTINGTIYLNDSIDQSGFELTIPLKSLNIDPPAAREQEGARFQSKVTNDDRAGTRKNMLGADVLDAARFPTMTIRSIKLDGPPWQPRITVRITLHGASRDYVVPTAIVRHNDRLIAIGSLTLRQSDFGITPFSVLAGALTVQDQFDVSFRLVASPDPQPD